MTELIGRGNPDHVAPLAAMPGDLVRRHRSKRWARRSRWKRQSNGTCNHGPHQVLAVHGAGEQGSGNVQDDEDQRDIGEDLMQLLPDATLTLLLSLLGLRLGGLRRSHEGRQGGRDLRLFYRHERAGVLSGG